MLTSIKTSLKDLSFEKSTSQLTYVTVNRKLFLLNTRYKDYGAYVCQSIERMYFFAHEDIFDTSRN